MSTYLRMSASEVFCRNKYFSGHAMAAGGRRDVMFASDSFNSKKLALMNSDLFQKEFLLFSQAKCLVQSTFYHI